jgi:hypothetical protein
VGGGGGIHKMFVYMYVYIYTYRHPSTSPIPTGIYRQRTPTLRSVGRCCVANVLLVCCHWKAMESAVQEIQTAVLLSCCYRVANVLALEGYGNGRARDSNCCQVKR